VAPDVNHFHTPASTPFKTIATADCTRETWYLGLLFLRANDFEARESLRES
jgi:hypothetical protein